MNRRRDELSPSVMAALRRGRKIEAIKRSDCTLVVSTVEQELLATETPDSMVRIVSARTNGTSP